MWDLAILPSLVGVNASNGWASNNSFRVPVSRFERVSGLRV